MRRDVLIKGKSLQGATDLTLVAPIKPGLIDALETRTYRNRLKAVARIFGTLRTNSREVQPLRPFSDPVDRVRMLHSFRIALIEPMQLVLAVTFDGAWEPYMAALHRELGPLLDVLLCNCDGYVTSHDHGPAEWADWVRRVQVPTEIFYNAAPLTVDDQQYLSAAERLQREQRGAAADLQGCAARVRTPREVAAAQAALGPAEGIAQGLQAVSLLYRLADLYPPHTEDGGILLRAAQRLLADFDTRRVPPVLQARYAPALAWFVLDAGPPRAAAALAPAIDADNVQGGILAGYDDATHGCLLLFSITGPDPAARLDAARFVEHLAGRATRASQHPATPPGGAPPLYLNVAFTIEGLRRLGFSETALAALPQEFREGMEARASTLGDLRTNHPGRWALPERNWPASGASGAAGAALTRLPLSMVHIVVQLRTVIRNAPVSHREIVGNPAHPLHGAIAGLLDTVRWPSVTLLSVQSLWSQDRADAASPGGHFGFADGISQPRIGADEPARRHWHDQVPAGDLLLGHPSSFDARPPRHPLLDDGTFLVVRKLRQNVDAYRALLPAPPGRPTADDVKAALMGRRANGAPLVALAGPADPGQPASNDFTYDSDPEGAACPFQAHARRANPRTVDAHAVDAQGEPLKPPRIFRRGLSYGMPHAAGDGLDRGVVFMACNASIAQQFEVVQRWVAGGNASGACTAQSDPLFGVPQIGDPRTLRFRHGAKVHRVTLDAPGAGPLVRLEWGAYLFMPSVRALALIAAQARNSAATADAPPWSAEAGEKAVQQLLALERQIGHGAVESWKAALEDTSDRSTPTAASIWAAIRERHGGVLRTVYGVLACSRERVDEVLLNADGRYSVRGYNQRLRDSLGEIYLGLDDGPAYQAQATKPNDALLAIREAEAFDAAYGAARAVLGKAAGFFAALAAAAGSKTFEGALDIKDLSENTLAALCNGWFGLYEGGHFQLSGWRWNWQPTEPPMCPAHYSAPSRCTFQPNPGPGPQAFSREHGSYVRQAMTAFVQGHRDRGSMPAGKIAKAVFEAFPADAPAEEIARTLNGVLMGFLPTVDGNLRATLFDWLNERTLWDVQSAWLLRPAGETQYQKALAAIAPALKRAMKLRPVPELVWRTALQPHRLGDVEVRKDDRVVVSIVSATQQGLGDDASDVYPVFGGDRRAPQHPTHACPAYEIATGVLLGTIAALVDFLPLKPHAAPLTVYLTGPVPWPPVQAPAPP